MDENQEILICECCGNVIEDDDYYDVEDKILCPTCYEAKQEAATTADHLSLPKTPSPMMTISCVSAATRITIVAAMTVIVSFITMIRTTLTALISAMIVMKNMSG